MARVSATTATRTLQRLHRYSMEGISVHAIFKRFAVSSSTLSSPLRKFQETGATLTRMDAHDEHCQSPTTPPAGVNVSDHNRLHEGGLRAQCPTVGPVVTAQHHGARWHLPQNRTGRSTNGGLRFSQRRMLPQHC